MTQGPTLAPAAVPLSDYPEEKNRRKKNQQIDRDQRRQADANHGVRDVVGAAAGRTMSLPHSKTAVVQTK